MTRGLSVFVRDNLEAFAVAIALALVVRHYSLEAFRIPSKSMMPTLIGADQGGDRILVDKYRWLFGEPHRWEPVVFQYPLNRARNFIKRLVGMPGERLRIDGGDIWTSRDGEIWTIERKPPDAQEALFFPYYPEPVESRRFFVGKRCWERGSGWEGDERGASFAVDASGSSVLRFLAEVVPYQSEGIYGEPRIREDGNAGRDAAGDLRVRFDLRVERAGTFGVVLTEQGLARRLVLAPEGSRAVVARAEGEERFDLDLRLEAGGEYSVSFANVDDALVIEVSGDAEAKRTIPFAGSGDADPENRIAYRVLFEAQGMKATVDSIRIDRDVVYSGDDEWTIPEGNYFMLGDNTNASKDSRRWEVAEVYLKDGTVIRWEEGHDVQDVPGQPDASFDIRGPDRVIEVKADVDGLVRRFHTKDVERLERDVPYGFVSKDHLVGRAFAIFWPIHVWPVFRGATRVGLIR